MRQHLHSTEDCDGPDLIYLPEVPFDIDKFLVKVKDLLKKKSSVVIAVSEGITSCRRAVMYANLEVSGDYVDAFGHKQLARELQLILQISLQQNVAVRQEL